MDKKSMPKLFSEKRNIDVIWICLIILLLIQVAFTAYINLRYTAAFNDYDSSGAYVHIFQIFREKTLFPQGYYPATTLDVDSTVGLAAILYGICGDIFLAQGICNILVVALYLFVFYEIFTSLHTDKKTMLIAMILLLIPYSRGMLGYWSMQFVNVAPNTIRNLIPLLYLSILLNIDEGKYGLKFVLKCIAALLLMLLTSISASYYVMAFGILSMICCDIFIFIRNEKWQDIFSIRWILHVMMVIMCVVGMKIQRGMGFSAAASKSINMASEVPRNSAAWFVGIFELFGATAGEKDVALISEDGIENCLKLVIALFFLACFAYLVYMAVRALRSHQSIDKIVLYIVFIGAIDGIALNYLNTTYGAGTYEYRYHIMPILFIMIGGGVVLDSVWKLGRGMKKGFMILCGTAFLILAVAVADIESYKTTVYENLSANELQTVDQFLEGEGVGTAIVRSDYFGTEGRRLRSYGDTISYINVNDSFGSDAKWGGSVDGLDAADREGKTALVTTEYELGLMPDYYKSNASYLDMIGNKSLYLMQEETFDFISGLVPEKTELIDFPYSAGYDSLNGAIQPDGSLLSDGSEGVALYGPYTGGIHGTWDYTLNYEIVSNEADGEASFEIVSNEKTIAKTSLDSTANSITISNVKVKNKMTNMEHRVNVPEGMVIKIISIEMTKVSDKL